MTERDDDPVENVQDTLKERLKSPFYASWLIAFVVWNWRAIYYLLFPDSDIGLEWRLYEIDNTVYPNFWEDHFTKLIVYPFVSACVAVAVVPWLLVILDGPRYRASIRMDFQRKKDDEKRIEQKLEIARLKQVIKENEGAWQSINESLQGTTKNYTDSLEARNTLQVDSRKKLALLLKHADKVKHEFIEIATGRGRRPTKDEVVLLDEELGLIFMDQGGVYRLTEEGTAVMKMM
jgi:hypothetical protein